MLKQSIEVLGQQFLDSQGEKTPRFFFHSKMKP
jgi:hypothetical protein